MIKAYPKIFAIGTDYIRDIFDGPVEITEKVDGSQFAFMKAGGELHIRSKGKVMVLDAPENMFVPAVDYVRSIEHTIPEGLVFYCEYLKTPHHNTLSYERVPVNHLCLFGVSDPCGSVFREGELTYFADNLGIEPVRVLYCGNVSGYEDFRHYLDFDSALGGCKIEGVVVKNYGKQFLLGGQPMPLMAGKFVSEKFKEVNHATWKGDHTPKGKWETFKEAFRTEARWEKAVQHLRDDGRLLNEPRDIGALIKEVQRDIVDEEQDAIKDFLFREFGSEITRKAIAGLPEWYKERLAGQCFERSA